MTEQPLRGQLIFKWWLYGERTAPHKPSDIAPLGMRDDGTLYVVLENVLESTVSPPLGHVIGQYWFENGIVMFEIYDNYKDVVERYGM